MSQVSYASCHAISKSLNETKDCTVKALAITAGIDYNQARMIMRMVGRKPGKGLRTKSTRDTIKTMQLAVRVTGRIVDSPCFPEGLTMNTVGERYSTGRYLVFTRGHVAALVDGKVEDWTDGRRNRVKFLMKVGV